MTLRPPVPAIDVHTHLFPERLMAAVRRALGDMYGWSFTLPDEPQAFAAFVRAQGTESFCILPYAHKPGMARSLNAWVARTAAELGGGIAFASVHPDDENKVALLDEAFAAGARGIKLHHQVQNVAPDDERLFEVYELMLARDRPLIVHAGKGPTDNGLVGAERFGALLARYPDLRICVAHFGWPEREEFLDLVRAHPNVYVDTSGVGNGTFLDLDLDGIADRVLFGTDSPNIVFPYDSTIERILELGYDDATNAKIFRENAVIFLKL